jgi:flagellar export protein FliJ
VARPFRLQTVVRLREEHRDAARAHLADALRAAEVLEAKRIELAGLFDELLDARRHAAATADTSWLLSAGRYELVLRADEKTLSANIAAVEQEIDRRRLLVAEADRELRAIEVLKERADQMAKREAAKREAKLLDEHASRAAFVAPSDADEFSQAY